MVGTIVANFTIEVIAIGFIIHRGEEAMKVIGAAYFAVETGFPRGIRLT